MSAIPWMIFITSNLFITGYGFEDNIFSRFSQKNIYKQEKRPHIILIMSDDQGWNDVGYHNCSVKTPNIDRLAKDGMRLENSYVQAYCTPSRAAVLTGMYPHRLGLQWTVIFSGQPKFLPKEAVTLPQKLKELNYTTHMTGKWHLGQCNRDLFPSRRGFDSFLGFLQSGSDYYTRLSVRKEYDFWKDENVYHPPNGSYNTDVFTERAIDIIQNHNPLESPLFLFLSHSSPHFPLQVPNRFKDMYPEVTDPIRKTYLGMVSSLDEGVGRVTDALEKHNYMDNTIIIFMSDNGGDYRFGGSNFPLRGNKGDLWEGGSKSVSFVYSPTYLKKQKSTHNGMIHAVDWFPTILDMAKHPKANCLGTDGVSQWKYIRRGSGSGRKEFVYHLDDYIANAGAIRFGKYKLIYGDPRVYVGDPRTDTLAPANASSTDVRLFDISYDPLEQHDLASKKPHIVRRLMTKLNRHRQYSLPALDPPVLPVNITQPNGIARPGWC